VKPAQPAAKPAKSAVEPVKTASSSPSKTRPEAAPDGKLPAGDSVKRVDPAGDMPAPEASPANPEHPTPPCVTPSVIVPSVTLDPPDTPPRTDQILEDLVPCKDPDVTPTPTPTVVAPTDVTLTEVDGGDLTQISNESEEFMTPLVSNNEPTDPLGLVLAAGAARNPDVPINIDGEKTCMYVSACIPVCPFVRLCTK